MDRHCERVRFRTFPPGAVDQLSVDVIDLDAVLVAAHEEGEVLRPDDEVFGLGKRGIWGFASVRGPRCRYAVVGVLFLELVRTYECAGWSDVDHPVSRAVIVPGGERHRDFGEFGAVGEHPFVASGLQFSRGQVRFFVAQNACLYKILCKMLDF